MRLAILALFTLTMATGHHTLSAQPKEKGLPRVNKLMEEKLKNSQKLLEGLATNDLEKIKTSAEELIRISKAAEWLVYKTPMYEVHTNNFRRSAETIVQKAK